MKLQITLFIAVLALALPRISQAEENIPNCGLYTYKAKVVRVIDGDTFVADIDLGFRTWLHGEHLRLFGVNTPENKTDEGKAVTQIVKAKIEGKIVYLCTIKAKRSAAESTGSFGRYLVVVYENGENLNEWLMASGKASAYMN